MIHLFFHQTPIIDPIAYWSGNDEIMVEGRSSEQRQFKQFDYTKGYFNAKFKLFEKIYTRQRFTG